MTAFGVHVQLKPDALVELYCDFLILKLGVITGPGSGFLTLF